MLKIEVSSFWTQKAGNELRHYEDAFWHTETEVNPFRAIVTDGSTVGVFSRDWAQELANGFKLAPLWWSENPKKRWMRFLDWLTPRQDAWLTNVKPRARRPESLRKGTYATMIALTIDREYHRFQALSIGDANLFHLRPGQFMKAWPVATTDGFGYHPDLIGSVATENIGMMNALKLNQGHIKAGDMFLMASDALSEWIVGNDLCNQSFNQLTALQGQFVEFINAQRENGSMKNDDVTLLVIKIKEEADATTE